MRCRCRSGSKEPRAASSGSTRPMSQRSRHATRPRCASAKLSCSNRASAAYRNLWQLDSSWLDAHPTFGEILDRLRESSRLPALTDYRAWKAGVLAGNQSSSEFEDWWHLPDGRMLHVMHERRRDGGLTCLYEDATERLSLESRFNALIQ